VFGDECLLLASGARHKWLRSLIQPALSPESIAKYTPLLVNTAERCLEEWVGECSGGQPVKALSKASAFAFEIITTVALGKPVPRSLLERLSTGFDRLIGGLFAPPIDLPFLPWGQAMRLVPSLSRGALMHGIDPARNAADKVRTNMATIR